MFHLAVFFSHVTHRLSSWNMKLRVRLNRQTSCLDLDGDEPTLTDLSMQVMEVLLPSCSLSPDTEFTLSLNGKEPLTDSGQSLSSCGIVSGDLICVILAQSDSPVSTAPPVSQSGNVDQFRKLREESRPPATQRSGEVMQSSSSCRFVTGTEEQDDAGEGPVSPPVTPEPMLCAEAEEGEVPHSLEVLHHAAQSRGPCDSLVVASHLLMLETGFVPQNAEGKPSEMPPGWRAEGGVYRLRYSHPLCEQSLATLAAVPMGSRLVINATLKMKESAENAKKLLLKPSTYVTDAWAGESAAMAYRDLKQLSRLFKDQLAYPLIASARQAMNLPAVFGLTALPPELLLRVLRLLDIGSVVSLSAVCRDLNVATVDPSLWRHLYRRDFRDPTNRAWETDWKELYKKKYKLRREESLFRRTRLFHPIPPQPMPFHPFPHGPNPLYPPGIIGGEYDQRPSIPYSFLPRPRFDPIGPQPENRLDMGGSIGRRSLRPSSSRSSDIRRGFI
ncbi:F-box only protein 7 isoform X1 [Paramormyrops kingsleyae]|uniref:F-box only protein 7 isoform X1 n=2 Tax=Paramormyrops kingsleyae TaxID=1676925 RepID=UPI003B978AD8